MQQSAREGTKVAPDWRYGLFLLFGLMLAGGSLFDIALGVWWTLPSPPHLDTSSLLSPLICLIEGITLLGLAWRFKVFNRRRQAAANADSSIPLATEQPTPNEAALPLPFTIRLVPRRAGSFAFGCLIGILFLLGTFWLPLIDLRGNPDTSFAIITAIVMLGSAIGLAIFTTAIFVKSGYSEITATEAGLTIRSSKMAHFIPWHEARLFAYYPGDQADWRTNLLRAIQRYNFCCDYMAAA